MARGRVPGHNPPVYCAYISARMNGQCLCFDDIDGRLIDGLQHEPCARFDWDAKWKTITTQPARQAQLNVPITCHLHIPLVLRRIEPNGNIPTAFVRRNIENLVRKYIFVTKIESQRVC